jgi:hypothetical protein
MFGVAVPLAPCVRLGGRLQRSETVYRPAGAYVVVLSTSLANLGVELYSTYVGHRGTDTQVIDLYLAPAGDRRSASRSFPQDTLPVVRERRLCLYDHLQQLQGFLQDLGYADVRIDGLEPALALVEQ